MNKYMEMRVVAEEAKRKVNEGSKITHEELAAIKYMAQANSSTANLTAYAVAKNNVQDENEE
jgi:hypothetical protein